jgi:septal ring factor EnvC (AmiA/AmiB activator)
MADEPFNLVLEHLKRIQGKLDALSLEMGDIKLRMSAVEGHLGQLMLQNGTIHSRLDRFDERLSRIERRLDLIEA